MTEKRKVLLVDSNNIAYRAFYALPPTIATSTGTMTNAVYGFTAMILKIIGEQKPDAVVCAFDSRGPTFRHELFEEYKAQRKKMPAELSGQMQLIREVMTALNISTIEIPGFEADDIIATISGKTASLFYDTIILSGDKDILQLVSENVKVISMKKGISDTVLYDIRGVVEKFGVEPPQIKDLLALMGDASDNIPGVQGIGPKTALELISQFGNVESIYKNIDKIKNEKLKNLLSSKEESARKSKSLTELNDGLEIDIEMIAGLKIKDFDYKKVEDVFDSLEFNTLKKRVKDIASIYGIKSGPAAEPGSFHSDIQEKIIKNNGDKEIIKIIEGSAAQLGVLSERSDLYLSAVTSGPAQDYLIIGDGEASYFVFDSNSLLMPEIKTGISILTAKTSLQLTGFDLKQACKLFKKYEIGLNAGLIDLKIMYLLLNPSKTDAAFEEVSESLTGENTDSVSGLYEINITDSPDSISNACGESTGKPGASRGDVKNMTPENRQEPHSNQMFFSFDAGKQEEKSGISGIKDFAENNKNLFIQMTLMPLIKPALQEKIKREGLDRLYNEIEGPLVKVLAEIEFKGVCIDPVYIKELIGQYDRDISSLTNDIFSLCDAKFNINSTKQLADVLYKKLNLSATKKTKTGYSTDAATLYSIYDAHPVIEKILDYREKVKLKNTYLDVLPTLVDPVDGRVHTTYNQLGTTTGRISSNNPNLQNIPVRTDLGRQIRKAFIPGTGYDILLSADYSQIELRILAHFSGDSDLIDAFNSGHDIHTRTAAEIFGVSYKDVDENLRRKAKAINFGIIYGMTEFGLKSRLSITEEEAREYIRLYFTRYPGVKKYLNHLIESAYRTGFTTTLFGRKRYIKELASTNANLRSLGERLAVNTPIQGSAADIMKLATVLLDKKLRLTGTDSNIILHVHDEIVLELKNEDADKVRAIVLDSMENCITLKVALKVDLKAGKNWYI
ncbi:MAG: DNA polymerase I [Actinobacteria bacterium ADurb.Bin346]|nr:MAG: DNA polymerase I [Actinobacteria bacterium ADurb.Bin346]